MKPKHQRLLLAILAVGAIIAAALLAMSALQDKAAYFYAPGDVKRLGVTLGKPMRLGGMVADHSIVHEADGVSIHFVVEDGIDKVSVSFKGITPELFREKSGVIAEGHFVTPHDFIATNILAKHDEKYKPPQMKGAKPIMGDVK